MLGGAGMVGHKAWQVFRQRFDDVYGTTRKGCSRYEGHPAFAGIERERWIEGLDLMEPERVLPVLDKIRPDVIFNCVGLTFRRVDSPNAEAHIRVNALLPHVLNRWCEANGKRFISLSTDCVFTGKTGGYTEESVTDAKDAYGRSKALGEVESDRALILRTSVVGREAENQTELLEWLLAQEGKTVKGYRKAIYTGLPTTYLAGLVADLIEKFPKLSGLYQVSSAPISKYDLLLRFRDAFKVNVEILPDDSKEARKNLIGTKFTKTTGIETPSWDELIQSLVDDPTVYPRGRD